MPKNKGKGGKNRRRGKNENEDLKRELIFRDALQQYAQVSKMLGNGRLEASCFDSVKRLCHIRGKLRKKVWINTGDIILLGLREYQDGKADVILKYTPDEARKLMALGEIPNTTKINEEDGGDDNIVFNYEEDGEDAGSDSESGSESGEEGTSGYEGRTRTGGVPVGNQNALAGMLPSSDSESDEEEDYRSYQAPSNAKAGTSSKKGGIDIDKI
jgi:translation initiation factor 1A